MSSEASGSGYPGDRRKPVARYVQFGDEDVQDRFIAAADRAFTVLVGSDDFAGMGEIELPPEQAPPVQPEPEKRGLFRRAAPPPPPAPTRRVVPATAALARVARDATEIPVQLESSPKGCAASVRVARILSTVALDLVGDLRVLTPAEQAKHPAYRQTLRLGAELQGLRDTVNRVGCTDPEGCVGIRPPDHWGRRIEDVEVSEVRAVLHRLAVAGDEASD